MSLKLETQITISASASKVWKVLMDFENHPNWNPSIKHISGKPVVGEILNIELGGMKFKPQVQEVEEFKKFSWLGKLFLKGVFDGRHEFLINEIDEKTVIFHQNEIFNGFFVPFFKKKLQKDTRLGFQEMNLALKIKCEN